MMGGGGMGMNYGAIAQGILGTAKIISGIIKHKEGKVARERHARNRPNYDIPLGMQKSLAIAEQLAAGDMPGYNRAVSQIGTNKADTLRRSGDVARSSADLLGATAAVHGQTDDAYQNLAVTNAAHKYNALGNLAGTQERMANFQDKKWELNEQMPWADKENELRNKQYTGEKQAWSGGQDVAASVANFFGGNMEGGEDPFVGQDTSLKMGSAMNGAGGFGGAPQVTQSTSPSPAAAGILPPTVGGAGSPNAIVGGGTAPGGGMSYMPSMNGMTPAMSAANQIPANIPAMGGAMNSVGGAGANMGMGINNMSQMINMLQMMPKGIGGF